MTATDPRPGLPRTSIRGLAAKLAEGLAPAAEALAAACAEDQSGPAAAGSSVDPAARKGDERLVDGALCPDRGHGMTSVHEEHDRT